MVEGLLSFLFYSESGINQYALQKTLTDVFKANLLLLEFGCLRYVLLPAIPCIVLFMEYLNFFNFVP